MSDSTVITGLVPADMATATAEIDESPIADVVRRAAAGDADAWDRLIDQYGRLIWAITRDFKLVESDASDVAQTTWLRLVEHIDRLQHPQYVGAWLATTAKNECLRHLVARKRLVLLGEENGLEAVAGSEPPLDEVMLAAERARTVREAIRLLPHNWQRLMELLMMDPPTSYAEISDRLGLPVGSIGPTRGRCLDRLRVLMESYV
jgi:RNA polymerase sigma factor (sigma-70 family)